MGETLYSLWMSSDLLKAREELKLLNNDNGWNIPPFLQALLNLSGVIKIKGLLSGCSRVTSSISELLGKREKTMLLKTKQKGQRNAVMYYNRTLKDIDSTMKELTAVSNFLKCEDTQTAIHDLSTKAENTPPSIGRGRISGFDFSANVCAIIKGIL